MADETKDTPIIVTTPPTSVDVVKDDSETRKRIKSLETKQSWLEDQLKQVTSEKDSLAAIVSKAAHTPSPISANRTAWQEVLSWLGLDN